MKKKGFTLIELLAVLTIFSIICLLAVPLILNQVKNNQKQISETQKEIIFHAAYLYLEDTIAPNSTYCVKIQDLLDTDLLDDPVQDLETGKVLSSDRVIKATSDNKKKLSYQLLKSGDSCTPETGEPTPKPTATPTPTPKPEVCSLERIEGKNENGIGWSGTNLINSSSMTGEYSAAGPKTMFKGYFMAGKSIRIYFIAIDGYTVSPNMQSYLILDDGTEIPVQASTSGPTMGYIDFTLPKTVSQFDFPLYFTGSGSKPGDSILKVSMQCN